MQTCSNIDIYPCVEFHQFEKFRGCAKKSIFPIGNVLGLSSYDQCGNKFNYTEHLTIYLDTLSDGFKDIGNYT